MAAESRLFENGRAVETHFETASAGRNHLNFGIGVGVSDGGRQTDGPRFIISDGAVLNRQSHCGVWWEIVLINIGRVCGMALVFPSVLTLS